MGKALDTIGKIGNAISPWAGVASGIIGMFNKNNAEKRQYQNQLNLMNHQQELNKELAEIGQNNNKALWDYTNYENQVEHMKRAGLSIGLMYGNGGQGGQSSGAQPQGVGMQQDRSVEMGLQAKALNSQIALNMAQAAKANAEADATSGYKQDEAKATIESLNAKVKNLDADNRLKDNIIEYNNSLMTVNEATVDNLNATMTKTMNEAGWILAKARKERVEANILEETESDLVQAAWLHNQELLTKMGLEQAETKKYLNDINISWASLQQTFDIALKERNLKRELMQASFEKELKLLAEKLDIAKYEGNVELQKAIIYSIGSIMGIQMQGWMAKNEKTTSHERETVTETINEAGATVIRRVVDKATSQENKK